MCEAVRPTPGHRKAAAGARSRSNRRGRRSAVTASATGGLGGCRRRRTARGAAAGAAGSQRHHGTPTGPSGVNAPRERHAAAGEWAAVSANLRTPHRHPPDPKHRREQIGQTGRPCQQVKTSSVVPGTATGEGRKAAGSPPPAAAHTTSQDRRRCAVQDRCKAPLRQPRTAATRWRRRAGADRRRAEGRRPTLGGALRSGRRDEPGKRVTPTQNRTPPRTGSAGRTHERRRPGWKRRRVGRGAAREGD